MEPVIDWKDLEEAIEELEPKLAPQSSASFID